MLASLFAIGPWTVLQSGEWSGRPVISIMQNAAACQRPEAISAEPLSLSYPSRSHGRLTNFVMLGITDRRKTRIATDRILPRAYTRRAENAAAHLRMGQRMIKTTVRTRPRKVEETLYGLQPASRLHASEGHQVRNRHRASPSGRTDICGDANTSQPKTL